MATYDDYCRLAREELHDACGIMDVDGICLQLVHPWCENDIMSIIYKYVEVRYLGLYMKCAMLCIRLMDYCDIEYDVPDSVFGQIGVVNHLYSMFFSFPNLKRSEIGDVIESCVMVIAEDEYKSPLIPADSWKHVEYDGEWTPERVIRSITQVVCDVHNSHISSLSNVWDAELGNMVDWLPKEIVEDVCWLNGEHTSSTMLELK